MAFDLSQLITQAGSFGTILFGFDTELDGTNAARRIDQLGHGTVLAIAGMFELVDEASWCRASASTSLMRR